MWVRPDTVRDKTIIYQINSASPTTQVEDIHYTYNTNDTYCPFTVTQLTHDPSVTNTDWQDNGYEIGYTYDISTSDWIWQQSGSNDFKIKTGDNADEANDFSTGPIILHSTATNGIKTV